MQTPKYDLFPFVHSVERIIERHQLEKAGHFRRWTRTDAQELNPYGCLAELQSALPGQVRTDRPLRLVLDRRPFI